jgi:hypothetical protein
VLNVRTGIPPELAAGPCTIRARPRTVPAIRLSTLFIFPLLSRAPPTHRIDPAEAPLERHTSGKVDGIPDVTQLTDRVERPLQVDYRDVSHTQ